MTRDLTEYNAQYYALNKVYRRNQVRERQKDLKEAIDTYKLDKGCSECGYKKCSRALQFHHTNSDEKEHNICRMVTQGRSLKSIFAEIEKCVVLCANCHAELHAMGA